MSYLQLRWGARIDTLVRFLPFGGSTGIIDRNTENITQDFEPHITIFRMERNLVVYWSGDHGIRAPSKRNGSITGVNHDSRKTFPGKHSHRCNKAAAIYIIYLQDGRDSLT